MPQPPRKRIRTEGPASEAFPITKTRSTGSVIDEIRRQAVREERERGRGLLHYIERMPLEIVSEVFGHLHPADLLSAASSCKRLRTFLLDRRQECVWRTARKGVWGLPERPPFISEPAFVRLLFSNRCDHCGRKTKRRVSWAWFKRYCGHCAQLMGEYTDDIVGRTELGDLPFFTTLHLPGPDEVGNIFNVVYTDPSNDVVDVHRMQLDAFVERWRSAGSTVEAKRSVYREQEEEVERIARHAEECQIWDDQQCHLRQVEIDAVRARRLEEIFSRLDRSGYGAAIDYLRSPFVLGWDPLEGRPDAVQVWLWCNPNGDGERIQGESDWERRFRHLPIVRMPAELTEKAFAQVLRKIKRDIFNAEDYLTKAARCRVLQARIPVLEKAIEALCVQLPRRPHMLGRPVAADLVRFPDIRAVVDSPPSVEVTVEDYTAVLQPVIRHWEAAAASELRSWLRTQVPTIAAEVDPLDLAIATFGCRRCRSGPLRYPAIVGHPCLRASVAGGPSVEGVLVLIQRLFRPLNSGSTASRTRQVLHIDLLCPKFLQNALAVLPLFGLRPDTTTLQEADGHPGRLAIPVHGSGATSTVLGLYTWDMAVRYSHDHRLRQELDWAVVKFVEGEVAGRVAAREASMHTLRLTADRFEWCCSLCVSDGLSGPAMVKHLNDAHGIPPNAANATGCIQDGTVFLHPQCTLSTKKAVGLI